MNMATKCKMVTNLEQEKPRCPPSLARVPKTRIRLEEFITKRMLKMFSIIAETGKKAKKSSLEEDPRTWETNTTFLEMKSTVSLKVINDLAERVVSLTQTLNASLTKD